LMMGSLRVGGPGAVFCARNSAKGSSRYPSSTALSRDSAASVSVPWMVISWPGVGLELELPTPPRPRPKPRPLPPPREAPRSDSRFGIDGADMRKDGLFV